MKKLAIVLTFVVLLVSCTYEKGGITDEMKTELISFEYESLGYYGTENSSDGKVLETRKDGILTLTFITEETGCPHFEGGYKIIDETLYLYYQDVKFQLVKCIDLFKLKYKISDKNLDYKKIEIVRLKPIKKGWSFKE